MNYPNVKVNGETYNRAKNNCANLVECELSRGHIIRATLYVYMYTRYEVSMIKLVAKTVHRQTGQFMIVKVFWHSTCVHVMHDMKFP